jgi:hypothetical protein
MTYADRAAATARRPALGGLALSAWARQRFAFGAFGALSDLGITNDSAGNFGARFSTSLASKPFFVFSHFSAF